ncbi:uncharacterized protein LOC129231861 isoform X2 [Uloborus diversus]|uniref:uncharacterized protein LOC129231861 isoform X2 n=1 Tax=Uloborus diversus TaxID=327109 RepID=UPI00240A8511|nr:uncharacterized protein LOC129231861 isoform X2 [Uloborus diversus]
MIQVLSKILGRKKSGSSENNSNASSLSSSKLKEGQSIWQKATNLRQSLRHSSKAKGGQKCVPEPPTERSDQATTLRREWGSQRNLARERRSLAAKAPPSAESASRSLQARSLCMSSDWDMEEELSPRSSRSPRKLTKDSGYETSAQGDIEGAISDRLAEQGTDPQLPPEKEDPPNEARSVKRLEWNTHHRPLSFSHQEVVSERGKSRPLRHSYSQREVSRQGSVESLEAFSGDLKRTTKFRAESVSNWSRTRPGIAKSTTQLEQLQNPRYSLSSTGSLAQPEHEEIVGSNMVTRKFKKGSVYDTLASTSGLDFSPIVHLKSCNTRKDDINVAVIKPSNKLWESTSSITKSNGSSPPDNPAVSRGKSPRKSDPSLPLPQHINPSYSPQEHKTSNVQVDENGAIKCIGAHEKYPSWPVSTSSSSSSVSYRSHSWTGQTDYPKEKVGYTRPKKANQFKISTNQLQPVLERAVEYNNSIKNTSESVSSERSKSPEKHPMKYDNATNCSNQQFDFEAFHTPCIPQCFDDKNYRINSPAERDIQSPSSSSSETPTNDSNRFINQYELRNQAQYAGSVTSSSSWSKSRNTESKSAPMSPDTPFLDRLRSDSAWQVPPPPVPMIPEAASAPQAQQQQPLLHPPANDFELSSENGTWMGSMESSSHGRGVAKWQGSYSDLSTLSTQLSNRSSLFDSGHSTMPESGRLSPQSSCDSTAPSLLLEGPTRAQVVARHGCHREIVAHSARVQQPERHGSESVLYYAAGSLVKQPSDASSSKKSNDSTNGSQPASEAGLYRSHASLNMSPQSNLLASDKADILNKSKNCPSRQDSRKSCNSFSSEDSNPRSRNFGGDDTSGSSSDVSNVTCISNYKGKKSKSLDETLSGADRQVPRHAEEPIIQTKYQSWNEPPSLKRVEDGKIVFPDYDKRQRISDPDLKAIQKQAVMSFYQRMSLAESKKSEKKSQGLSMPDMEGPPPYDTATARLKVNSKLSLYPNFKKPSELKNSKKCPPPPPEKPHDNGLLNSHSKSVPNLMTLKSPSLDLPPSHPIFRYSCSGPLKNIEKNFGEKPTQGHALPNDEIISWDLLPNVLEKKRETSEKASTSIESKDPPEDNTGCASNMHYFKTHKSPRKVQLKEVHHSNETASVKVMTPDGVTLVQASEKSKHKRRPAPPPPPKQPPKRPPPPPPPVTPPPEVVVVLNGEETESSELDKQLEELKIYPKNSYMSYRSEKKVGRQGFNGKYTRSFTTSASSVDLTTFDSSFHDADNVSSPSSWEEIHNIRQHNATVIFHSNNMSSNGRLQRSSSQNCVSTEDVSSPTQNNISNGNLENTECNQSSNSINAHSEGECVPVQPVPYLPPSQEANELKNQNSVPETHNNSNSTKVLSTNCCPQEITNLEPTNEVTPILDNNFQVNNSYTELPSDKTNLNLDHNQNTVKYDSATESSLRISYGNHLINRTNSATQTSYTLKLKRKSVKSREELECERLSKEFIDRYEDATLKKILIPTSHHKTMYDYLDGLYELEICEQSKFQNTECPETNENMKCETIQMNNEKLESKIVNNQNAETTDNQTDEDDLKSRKEELILSIGKKVDTLKIQQNSVKEEIIKNEMFGQEISNRLGKLAKPNELEKFNLHVEEMEKILSLLLSLSGRLAKAENILENLPKESNLEEKKILESKRDKLKEQHEDARRLKESIDRRSFQVSAFLRRYFTDDEYTDYNHFLKMKTKLIIDIRELDEKIHLGEEQLAALSVVAHLWKSANSCD